MLAYWQIVAGHIDCTGLVVAGHSTSYWPGHGQHTPCWPVLHGPYCCMDLQKDLPAPPVHSDLDGPGIRSFAEVPAEP